MSGVPRPCELCGLAIGVRPVALRTAEKELQFCCEACRGIYEMLHEGERAPASGKPPGRGVTTSR